MKAIHITYLGEVQKDFDNIVSQIKKANRDIIVYIGAVPRTIEQASSPIVEYRDDTACWRKYGEECMPFLKQLLKAIKLEKPRAKEGTASHKIGQVLTSKITPDSKFTGTLEEQFHGFDPSTPKNDKMVCYEHGDTWLEEYIEEPVRDLVGFLRENGINTECSCGHNMYIQCQYAVDGELQRLHKLLFNFCHYKKKSIDYTINVTVRVVDGHMYQSLTIYLGERKIQTTIDGKLF